MTTTSAPASADAAGVRRSSRPRRRWRWWRPRAAVRVTRPRRRPRLRRGSSRSTRTRCRRSPTRRSRSRWCRASWCCQGVDAAGAARHRVPPAADVRAQRRLLLQQHQLRTAGPDHRATGRQVARRLVRGPVVRAPRHVRDDVCRRHLERHPSGPRPDGQVCGTMSRDLPKMVGTSALIGVCHGATGSSESERSQARVRHDRNRGRRRRTALLHHPEPGGCRLRLPLVELHVAALAVHHRDHGVRGAGVAWARCDPPSPAAQRTTSRPPRLVPGPARSPRCGPTRSAAMCGFPAR